MGLLGSGPRFSSFGKNLVADGQPGDGRFPGGPSAGRVPRARRRYRGWYRLISPVAVVVLWQLASSAGLIPEDKLPPPTTVWHTAVSLVTTTSPAYGTLPDAMLVSGCTPGGARAPPVSGLPDPGVIPGLLQRAVVSMTGN